MKRRNGLMDTARGQRDTVQTRKHTFSPKTLARRITAGVLAMGMVLTTALSNVGITAWAEDVVEVQAAPTKAVERVADDYTGNAPDMITETSSENSGRVWTDKSVVANNGSDGKEIATIDGQSVDFTDDFLEVFSALGSSQAINLNPVDLVFVLDMSGSMGNGEKGSKGKMAQSIEAINRAMDILMSSNANNRVGIAVFAHKGETFLPLAHYSKKDNAEDYISVESKISDSPWYKYTLKANVVAEKDYSVWSGAGSHLTSGSVGAETNLDAGLTQGFSLFDDISSVETSGKKHIPAMIVLSDGALDLCTEPAKSDGKDQWWGTINPPLNAGINYNRSDWLLRTLMRAAYHKASVLQEYNSGIDKADPDYTEFKIYSVGIDLGEGQTNENAGNYHRTVSAMAALNPVEGFTQTQADKAKSNSQYAIVSNAWETWNNWKDKDANSEDYVERNGYRFYQLSGTSVTQQDVIDNINYIESYQGTSGADGKVGEIINNIIGNVINDAFHPTAESTTTKSALVYTDPIGKYMEIKEFKELRLFGQTYTNIQKDGAEEKGTDGITRQKYVVSPDSGDGNLTNISYTKNNEFNLKDIKITVETKNDSTYGKQQTLVVSIPQAALPIQMATISYENGKLAYKTNLNTDYAKPLRLIYTLGMQADILKDGEVDMSQVADEYKTDSRYLKDGEVIFYTNEYTGINESGDAYTTFEPSGENRYYVYPNVDKDTYYTKTGDEVTLNNPAILNEDKGEPTENEKNDQIKKGKNGDGSNPSGTAKTADTPEYDRGTQNVTTHHGNNGCLTAKIGALLVTKEVVADADENVPDDAEFEFTLKLTKNGTPLANKSFEAERWTRSAQSQEGAGGDTGESGPEWSKAGDAALPNCETNAQGELTFKLKANEGIYFPYLPAGTECSVTEKNLPSGFKQLTVSGNPGSITVGEQTEIHVTNQFGFVSTEATIVAKKLLVDEGTAEADKMTLDKYKFKFTLTPDPENDKSDPFNNPDILKEVFTDSVGDITFGSQIYTVPGEYKYRLEEEKKWYKQEADSGEGEVDEETGNSVGNIEYDSATYTVIVDVHTKKSDDGNYELEATVTYYKDGQSAASATFTNRVKERETQLTINGTKIFVKGDKDQGTEPQIIEDGQFTFQLLEVDAATVTSLDGLIGPYLLARNAAQEKNLEQMDGASTATSNNAAYPKQKQEYSTATSSNAKHSPENESIAPPTIIEAPGFESQEQIETNVESGPSTETEPGTETELAAETVAESGVESVTEPDTESETEPSAEVVTESSTEMEPDNTESETELGLENGKESGAEAGTEPSAEAELNAETEMEEVPQNSEFASAYGVDNARELNLSDEEIASLISNEVDRLYEEGQARISTMSLSGINWSGAEEVTNIGSDFRFAPITYKSAGTYFYKLREKPGEDNGIVYDDTVHTIEVKVTADPGKYTEKDRGLYIETVKVDGEVFESSDTHLITFTFKNYYNPKVKVKVTKKWDEDDNGNQNTRPESITVTLKRGIAGGEFEEVQSPYDEDTDEAGAWENPKTLSGAKTGTDKWMESGWTWENLPKFDPQGNDYNYIVEEAEIKTSEGGNYTSKVEGPTKEDGSTLWDTDTEYHFTITNTLSDKPKVSLQVTKIWHDSLNAEGDRPNEIAFIVKQDGKPYPNNEKRYVLKLDEGENWSNEAYTLAEDLPKYNPDTGDLYRYSIEEVQINGYELPVYSNSKVETDGTCSFNEETNTWSVTVTNERVYKTSVVVQKKWTATEGEVPDEAKNRTITVELQRNGNPTSQKAELNEDNGWKNSFTDLPKYESSETDAKINYSVEELNVPDGFTSSIGDLEEKTDTEGIKYYYIEVTNTYTPVYIDITVKKEWEDLSNKLKLRPNITVQLKRKEQDEADYEDVGDPVTLTSADASIGNSDEWTHTWNKQDQYYYEGGVRKSYIYTVEETIEGDIADYYVASGPTEPVPSEDGKNFTITLTNTLRVARLRVAKWIDNHNNTNIDQNDLLEDEFIVKVETMDGTYKAGPVLKHAGEDITADVISDAKVSGELLIPLKKGGEQKVTITETAIPKEYDIGNVYMTIACVDNTPGEVKLNKSSDGSVMIILKSDDTGAGVTAIVDENGTQKEYPLNAYADDGTADELLVVVHNTFVHDNFFHDDDSALNHEGDGGNKGRGDLSENRAKTTGGSVPIAYRREEEMTVAVDDKKVVGNDLDEEVRLV